KYLQCGTGTDEFDITGTCSARGNLHRPVAHAYWNLTTIIQGARLQLWTTGPIPDPASGLPRRAAVEVGRSRVASNMDRHEVSLFSAAGLFPLFGTPLCCRRHPPGPAGAFFL